VHKYEKLEKIYYRKKFFRFLFVIFILIVLIILIFSFFKKQPKKHIKNGTNNKIKIIKKDVNKTKDKNQTKILNKKNFISKKFNKEKNITKKNKENNKTILSPILKFTIPKIEFNNTVQNQNKNIKVKKKLTTNIKKPIIVEENINIKDLINSYNKNPTFDLAIQISEFYLNKNDINLAKLWALKANTLNPSRFESWKIFAIILLKRNEKEKAKEVLKTYLNDYGENEEIEKLLRSINE